ncbi:lipopolysaccharide transport periplasmic protein LptA [Oceanibium sediminis]|uniref:lipopolysaccharide transport periplasmic protein LptA n=1 Tax=Oceanibium sediminis TaxID=2026339 RepID=UPI000DD3375D|nr:lipopolysaccharide transport periplasmic protein LptA [Oceanibium sediminis]
MRQYLTLALILALTPALALAQAEVPFGGLAHDNSQPVEVSADRLTLNTADGSATFAGNVVVGQGALRMAAEQISVFYGTDAATGDITRMEATGNVTLTNGDEAAEAQSAVYDVRDGTISMTGEVLLTQGGNALSGQKLSIDLSTGTAEMEGRVQTILRPSSSP